MRQTNDGVGQAFRDAVLPSDHASALHAAVHELIDQFFKMSLRFSKHRRSYKKQSMSH
jgi:hypothetical protein